MVRTALLALCLVLGACAAKGGADPLSDAPERHRADSFAYAVADSYAETLKLWREPEDVNAWIGGRFSYDMQRAMRLSESQRGKSGPVPIYEPEAFFKHPSGVCVDLSRFAVETLQRIRPDLNARYLMLEFAPLTVQGNTLRLHWMAVFQRDGVWYAFADSKRPGHLAGPYQDLNAFIAEYGQYRNRKIVSFQVRESYKKTRARRSATPETP